MSPGLDARVSKICTNLAPTSISSRRTTGHRFLERTSQPPTNLQSNQDIRASVIIRAQDQSTYIRRGLLLW